ncbi:MAG: DUF418 domain-containing protein [Chitinophagaceae bacterium]|nr:DUF418 domain-containing protein [Chitinophagaceae bacterium]MBA3970992.1 DUF418 domain-containing protein [Bacteroidota bacterium]
MQPTTVSERFAILDVLRGFALLGVLLANMATHSGYFFLSDTQQQAISTAEADSVIVWILHFLVEGKFYSLFSLLFGIGFALQMKRSTTLQANFSGRYSRRLFILFLMGLLHAVLFYVGDILTVYAITGLFLLLFRKASDKTLLRSAVIFMVLPIIQYGVFWGAALLSNAPPPPPDPTAPRFFDQLILQYQTGSFVDIIQNNIGGLIFGRYPDLFFTGRFFRVLAMFLLGFYVTRKMIFANISANRLFLRKVMVWGAVIGIPCNLALAMIMETNAYYGMEPLGIIQPLVYAFGVPALSLFYAAGICLMYQNKSSNKVLNIFSPVGRMALTNYLMQSVICCFIFMNYGFGWFAKVGPVYLMLIGIGIYLFQVLFSHWWLGRFRFGPIEWLWRSATYWKWQPMKK